jgi:hypothetical protein
MRPSEWALVTACKRSASDSSLECVRAAIHVAPWLHCFPQESGYVPSQAKRTRVCQRVTKSATPTVEDRCSRGVNFPEKTTVPENLLQDRIAGTAQ